MVDTFDYNQVEERIRPHVRWLREQGVETDSSCGHDMYVMIDWPLNRMDALVMLLRDKYADAFTIEISPDMGPLPLACWIKIQFSKELAGDGKPEDLVLLKVDPASHPLYFVLRRRCFDASSRNDDQSYFYDEHTCPINWTGDIKAVIAAGDPDPHGFATFVRRIPAPDVMDDCNDHQYLTLFPEAANG